MADAAALQSLLSNLGQLISYHAELIAGVRQDVYQLRDDMNYFESFLKYASRKKLKDDERARGLVARIREALYDAEDVVDLYVTQNLSKSKNWLRRLWPDPIRLDRIAQKVRRVMRDASSVYGDKTKVDLMLLELGDVATEVPEFAPVRERNVVGLEDEAETIIGYIKEETERLDVISIVGMAGLGKSTLAGKIFRDPVIQYEFPTRLWVYVSKFSTRDVYLNILKELTTVTDEMRGMEERELAEKVKGYLARGKFLIVMDDVWTEDDWKKIARALPTTNHLSKILITSRDANVAVSANRHRVPHSLRPLNSSESVQLLQYEVFGEPKWEPGSESHGILIAGKCKGLPLAIVVIGGIIVRKLAAMATEVAKLDEWRNLSKSVQQRISDDRMMERVIELSYETLSFHLKACFLYFAMFPEDVEIPAWKLFRMWIAEGFVEPSRVSTSEETAKGYLDELVTRNLVKVEKANSYGKVKTCRIHDTLREFCKKRAREDNFLDEIVSIGGNLTPAANNDKSRRLCIHSNISTFISSKPLGRRVRSFVCFSKEDVALQQQHSSAITGAYKLLRVLDVEPVKFTKIPSDVGDLLHLRHIHLSCNLKILPPFFSGLWNVQTLVFDTTERILTIKADIWKLLHLSLMKTNATAILPEPSKEIDKNSIQTLGSISTENCTEKVLKGARNLRRLSIRGELEILVSSNGRGSFDNMRLLGELEKLKLQNDPFPKSASEVPLTRLPMWEKFPPKLRILTLSKTCLDWNQMCCGIAAFENLIQWFLNVC